MTSRSQQKLAQKLRGIREVISEKIHALRKILTNNLNKGQRERRIDE